jgi:DNA-binding MarR family transcriptional regulator
VKSKTVTTAVDPTQEALASLVDTLRTLQLATGGQQPWLCVDLTMAQFKSVLLIGFTGGMTSRGLADQLGVGPSAVTPLVDRLVDQKLAVRESDDNDRRVIWVRPTAKATALQSALLQTSRSLMAEVVEGLNTREEALVRQALGLLLERAQAVLARHRAATRK